MNRLERVYRLHDLLRNARRPVSMRRLTESLGISRNTVTRDFEYMRDFLGAPIIYDRDLNGHLYDPDAPVFELPGLWMNASELHALLACEQLLESVQPGFMADRLGPLKRRIRKLLGEGADGSENLGDRVRVQPVQTRPVNNAVFLPVADATLAGRKLVIRYRGRKKDDNRQRTVDPQRLLHYRGNWYLVAWCHEAEGLRQFALDRIDASRALDESGRLCDPDELDAYASGAFGIFSGPAREAAHLRFTPYAARWAAEEQWHPEQRGEWRDDGFHLWVPYSDPTELTREILAWGPDVAVLEPPDLRSLVAGKVGDMAGLY